MMKPWAPALLILSLGLVSFMGCSSKASTSVTQEISPEHWVEKSKAVNAYLEPFVKADTPGGAVIVIQDGQIRHRAGYGLADLSNASPIRVDSQFHIGSVGKMFTALGVMMLAEEGRFLLDDPIGNHIPELQRYGPELTIRRLLHHTSGVPDYYEDDALLDALMKCSSMPGNEDMIQLLSKAGQLRFTPGTRFRYSNTGYDILGSLIERISGQPYSVFMNQRVFRPLGMERSFSIPGPDRSNLPHLAHSYILEEGQVVAYDSDPLDNLVGSGSLYSTIEDMARFDEALYGNKLLSTSRLAEAFQPGMLTNGKFLDYGFGWCLGHYYGQSYVGHDGAWLGFVSYYARFPDERLSVIVLLNRDYELPEEDLAIEIAGIYLK